MRARLALYTSGIGFELREVVLKDKPPCMLDLSPKGTVPVLQLPDGRIIDESLDIMRFAVAYRDPDGWGDGMDTESQRWLGDLQDIIIPNLNKYKYAARFDGDIDPITHRTLVRESLMQMNKAIDSTGGGLVQSTPAFVDFAVLPFVRQFSLVDPDWFNGEPWPPVINWLTSLLKSPVFLAIMQKYPQWHAGDLPTLVNQD